MLNARKEVVKYWRLDPVLFAKHALGFNADDWQQDVLHDIRDHPMVAVRSGQGVGKTSVEAIVILWFLVCFPNSKIICTAPTRQQLNEVLWAEVAKWLNKSIIKNLLEWTKTKVYMVGSSERWFATAKTATKPENMQGFHEDNMLFVVDEAPGISDDIMEAILGTLSGANNKILMMGNPTRTSGIFYDAFHKDSSIWKTKKVSSRDSSRTNKGNIERLERRYGKDSDVVRVRVHGEFPKGEPNAFITLESVERAINRELPKGYKLNDAGQLLVPHYAPIDLGVDVARFGDDETVIATRIGDVVLSLQNYCRQSTTKTCGEIIKWAKQLSQAYNRHVSIKIDDTGVGGGVTDRLHEVIGEQTLDISVHPINFASRGNDDYRGIISAMYGNFKDNHLPNIVLPNDEEMRAQFSVRRYNVTSDGKIEIEAKQRLKERGLPSPDRAEAIVMAFYDAPKIEVAIYKEGI